MKMTQSEKLQITKITLMEITNLYHVPVIDPITAPRYHAPLNWLGLSLHRSRPIQQGIVNCNVHGKVTRKFFIRNFTICVLFSEIGSNVINLWSLEENAVLKCIWKIPQKSVSIMLPYNNQTWNCDRGLSCSEVFTFIKDRATLHGRSIPNK